MPIEIIYTIYCMLYFIHAVNTVYLKKRITDDCSLLENEEIKRNKARENGE